MTSRPGDTPARHDARMAWFREAKFGLFIHWGVYAVPAGVYQGKEVATGTAEWIMNYARIPVAEYKQFAHAFNPVKYDPDAWMALAQEAGMKYVVITTKHHDGFALFHSKVSDWNVVQATPYGKDLIGPLAKAARARGLKLGLYYSHDLDWAHPGGGGYMMERLPNGQYARAGGKWDPAQEGSFDDYLRDLSVPQLREILTAYQPDMIWFDYAQNITPQRARPFIDLIESHPDLVCNNRLGGGFPGDLGTPEQHIPDSGPKDQDWEACMTMNDTWGFRAGDHHWKSPDDIIRMLVDVAGKGGNLLLNVGPTSEGTFPRESIDHLKAVGAWMKVHGEAIYGTRAGPYISTGAYTSTCRGNLLYLFLHPNPRNTYALPPLPARILNASWLGGGKAEVDHSPDHLNILLPGSIPSEPVHVLKLTLDADTSTLPPMKK